MFSLNAQRICHREKFSNFCTYIESFITKPTIIGVTETWFKSNETGEDQGGGRAIRLYELEGYDSNFSSRAVHSAGIALYVREGYNFELTERGNGNVSFIYGKLTIDGGKVYYLT